MTGTIYQGYIKDSAGNIIEGASVEVRDQDTNTVVTLWSDRATLSTKTNPTLTDANGYFFFYRTAGRYKITVTSDTYNATFNNVPIGNAMERDIGSDAGDIPLISQISAVGLNNQYASLTGLPTLGTMAALDTGTAAGQFRTNSQNDGHFLRITNNLSDVVSATARANLGLGTAATANVTASSSDVTAGRVLLAEHGVNLGGTQTIAGAKTFSSQIVGSAGAAVTGAISVVQNAAALKLKAAASITNIFQEWYTSADVRRGYFGYPDSGQSNLYLMNEEAGPVVIGTNSAEVIRVLSGGNVHIGGTTDPGVKLGVTGAISATTGVTVATGQDVLEDYEVGTWTPTLTCATPGDLSVAYNVRIGHYTRKGDEVTLYCHVEAGTFTHTTASGLLQVTGLPFTVIAVTDFYSHGFLFFQGVTKASYTQFAARANFNSSVLSFAAAASAQPVDNVTMADMPTGTLKVLRFTITVKVQ